MDMKEWIIIGGGALIGLIVLHGLFMAWWRSRDPLRMKIQPGLLPEDADEDAWLSAELPNGGARVVSNADATDARAEYVDDDDEGIPVLLDAADPQDADGADQAEESAASARGPLPDMAPIVPERGLGSGRADEPSMEQAAVADSEPEAMPEAEVPMPEAAASFDDSHTEAEAAPVAEDASEDLLAIHIAAPENESFSGDALFAALRAQDLRFGEMSIFHRIDADTEEAVFSVVRAVEPGSFDLGHIEACASPGLIAFLRLPSQGDPEAVRPAARRKPQALQCADCRRLPQPGLVLRRSDNAARSAVDWREQRRSGSLGCVARPARPPQSPLLRTRCAGNCRRRVRRPLRRTG